MRRPRSYLIVVMVAALFGLTFAGVSTYDFVQHLDRQAHDIHCSFVPGLAAGDGAASGCRVTMMSPYSSVLRARIWGGVPISLPAMSVFAFLLLFSVDLVTGGRQFDRRATGFLLLAAGLPAAVSVIMAGISLLTLGAVCKLCIGIYLSSAVGLGGAFLLWRETPAAAGGAGAAKGTPAQARRPHRPSASEKVDDENDPGWVSAATFREDITLEREVEQPASAVDGRYLGGAFGLGCLVVLVPILVYLGAAPAHERFIGGCGGLADAEDRYGVLVPLDRNPGATPAIEVLDPLCPACRAFEHRLASSGLDASVDRKALLFPLDHSCNWMVSETMHPGACAISEAVLCAGDDASAVVEWSFAEQDAIMEATRAEEGAAAAMAKARFPELASCIGSAEVRARLNRSLRWAVRNQLQVLTPQLFVQGVKLCDEDVDLGLDFALSRLVRGELGATPEKPAVAPEPDRAPPEPAAPKATATQAAAPTSPSGEPAAAPSAAEPAGSATAPAAPVAPVDGPKAEGPTSADTSATEPTPTPAGAEPAPQEAPPEGSPGANETPPSEENAQ